MKISKIEKYLQESNNQETVLLPIKVPKEYCWGFKNACEFFEGSGASARCKLHIAKLHSDENYNVKRPKECLQLKKI